MDKQIRSELYSICNNYHRNNEIEVSYLPDFEIDRLCAIYMQDSDSANEAMGADNVAFEQYALPALISFLSDDTKKTQDEFLKKIKICVRHYFDKRLQEDLEEVMSDFIYDTKTEAGYSPRRYKDNGELYWHKGGF